MNCGTCGEPATLRRSVPIRDESGKEVGRMNYYICDNGHQTMLQS